MMVEISYSQVEGFVEFWRPVVAFGFCRMLPLLVAKMWANQNDLHKWTKHAGSLPFEVISCDN